MLWIWSLSSKAAQMDTAVIKEIELPVPHNIHTPSPGSGLNFLCIKTEHLCLLQSHLRLELRAWPPSWLQLVLTAGLKCSSSSSSSRGTTSPGQPWDGRRGQRSRWWLCSSHTPGTASAGCHCTASRICASPGHGVTARLTETAKSWEQRTWWFPGTVWAMNAPFCHVCT